MRIPNETLPFLDKLTRWATAEMEIMAVALVGSHARSAATKHYSAMGGLNEQCEGGRLAVNCKALEDSVEQNSMQARLLDLIQRAYRDENAFISALSDEERDWVGSPNAWSAKDLIAHITSWKQRIAEILAAAARGETPPTFADEDALNAETFERNRSRTWTEVLAEADHAVSELSARVKELSEDALTKPDYFAWREGRAIHEPIASNGFGHSQSHLAEWYLKHGELARANEIQERLAEVRRGLDDSPRNRAIATYNLACFYALTAQSDKAIPLLADAFQLSPDLIEWSKQDHDLDTLHDNHEFQSLVRSG